MTKMRCQDYVIKDGRFVGEFEEMYKAFEDPWLQSDDDKVFNSRRIIVKNWIKRIVKKAEHSISVCEVGCGFGHITAELVAEGVRCFGTDISQTAIEKARKYYPNCVFEVSDFSDFYVHRKHKTNVFMLAEILGMFCQN